MAARGGKARWKGTTKRQRREIMRKMKLDYWQKRKADDDAPRENTPKDKKA